MENVTGELPDQRAAVDGFFADVERAHQAEDVETYLSFFAPDIVWVTSRGVCYRGRDELGTYLGGAIPSGLRDGSVHYRVDFVHPIAPAVMVVIVDQTYTDRDGEPRDERARHTHSYVVTLDGPQPLILAGQNTVNVAD